MPGGAPRAHDPLRGPWCRLWPWGRADEAHGGTAAHGCDHGWKTVVGLGGCENSVRKMWTPRSVMRSEAASATASGRPVHADGARGRAAACSGRRLEACAGGAARGPVLGRRVQLVDAGRRGRACGGAAAGSRRSPWARWLGRRGLHPDAAWLEACAVAASSRRFRVHGSSCPRRTAVGSHCAVDRAVDKRPWALRRGYSQGSSPTSRDSRAAWCARRWAPATPLASLSRCVVRLATFAMFAVHACEMCVASP